MDTKTSGLLASKAIRVLCAFALAFMLIPVGAFSAMAETAQQTQATSSSSESGSSSAATDVFAEADPDEDLTAAQVAAGQTDVPDYYQVLAPADDDAVDGQTYTLYYYTIDGKHVYRVYGTVDGANIGYYAYDETAAADAADDPADIARVDVSKVLDQADEAAAVQAAEEAAAQKAAAAAAEAEAAPAVSAQSDEGLAPMAADYAPDSPNFHVNITNLALGLASSIPTYEKLFPTYKAALSYHWNIGFDTSANSFQSGDTVSIPSTGLAENFTFDIGWSTNVTTPEGVNVATMTMDASGTLKITFNDNVTGMNLTNLEGNYDTQHGTVVAKDLNLTVDTVKTITIADASVDKTFLGGNRLYLTYSGSGTYTIDDMDGGTSVGGDPWDGAYYQYSTTATGDIKISSKPKTGATLISVNFTDGSGNVTTLTPDENGQETLSASSLTHWSNTLKFFYTTPPTAMDESTVPYKVQWRAYADSTGLSTQRQFDSFYGQQPLIGFYQSDGSGLTHNGNANNNEYNVFYEDELPGGATGTWKTPVIYTGVMKAVTITNSEGNTVKSPTGMELGGYNFSYMSEDLVASGMFNEITPTARETIASFRVRVKADPLSYGIYNDAAGNSYLMVNLGSPSNPNATSDEAVKIQNTNVWSQISSDATLSVINGPTNCVGGNAQIFRISAVGDYEGNVCEQGLSNTATATTEDGTITNMGPANYMVPGNTILSLPSSGWLNVIKRDAISGEYITGCTFNIKKWDSGTSSWVDYSSTNVPQNTGVGGLAHMGTMVVGTYRVYETSAPGDYDISSIAVQSTGGRCL